jgi:hypothetical protein
VLVWSKLKDNGYYDRAGVAWVISDEAVFEVKSVFVFVCECVCVMCVVCVCCC